MLVCLNLRSMILTMNYTISSVGFLHFFPYLCKTGHLMEVRFLGADLYRFFIPSPSTWSGDFVHRPGCNQRKPSVLGRLTLTQRDIALEELWTVILSDQVNLPRKPFLNRLRKSRPYYMVLAQPVSSNQHLAWIWPIQGSVTEMALGLPPSSDLWMIIT